MKSHLCPRTASHRLRRGSILITPGECIRRPSSRQPVVILMLAFLLLLSGSSEGRAWNDAGHMTIARIAWDELTPTEQASVVAILNEHPHRERLLLKGKPSSVSEQEWIFLKASVWPDDVRPPKSSTREDHSRHPIYKYHRSTWHYVNFAYTAGQKGERLPEHHLSDESNILNELDQTMKVLVDGRRDPQRVPKVTDAQNRAIRMAWLMHLIGDLHQPMHVVALVDRKLFPDSPHHDQGGNRLAVRKDAESPPKNLHRIWDEMFSDDSRFDQIRQQAERIARDPALKQATASDLTTHLTFRDWAGESYRVAKTSAYLDGKLPLVLLDPSAVKPLSDADVPLFPPEGLQRARRSAQERILLAGRRLAVKLREVIHR